MTQIKCRSQTGNGLTQEAWKYVMRREIYYAGLKKRKERREAQLEAEKANITLPKLKWMEGK